MAQDSDTINTEEMSNEARLTFAVRAIERDPNLRFFARVFLQHCSALIPNSVYDADPAQNVYNQGVQAAGIEFARMLTQGSPLLIPALLVEELKNAQTD